MLAQQILSGGRLLWLYSLWLHLRWLYSLWLYSLWLYLLGVKESLREALASLAVSPNSPTARRQGRKRPYIYMYKGHIYII